MSTEPSAINRAKALWRSQIRAARRGVSAELRGAETTATCAQLVAMVLEDAPAAVASYLAMPDELDLADFHRACWNACVGVLVPRVAGPGLLTWHWLASADDLTHVHVGSHGIREPDPAALPAVSLPIDIPIIVPGVAFTSDGLRLGQGGGFYDRILASISQPTIGVGFSCQLVGSLPVEDHDQRVGALVLGGMVVKRSI